MSQFTQSFVIRPHALVQVGRRLKEMIACFNSRKYGRNLRRTVQMKSWSCYLRDDGMWVVKVSFWRRSLSVVKFIWDKQVTRQFRLFNDYDFSKAMRQLAKARV